MSHVPCKISLPVVHFKLQLIFHFSSNAPAGLRLIVKLPSFGFARSQQSQTPLSAQELPQRSSLQRLRHHLEQLHSRTQINPIRVTSCNGIKVDT
jgi:hypothetical protein